jgi:hypothetical protein
LRDFERVFGSGFAVPNLGTVKVPHLKRQFQASFASFGSWNTRKSQPAAVTGRETLGRGPWDFPAGYACPVFIPEPERHLAKDQAAKIVVLALDVLLATDFVDFDPTLGRSVTGRPYIAAGRKTHPDNAPAFVACVHQHMGVRLAAIAAVATRRSVFALVQLPDSRLKECRTSVPAQALHLVHLRHASDRHVVELADGRIGAVALVIALG